MCKPLPTAADYPGTELDLGWTYDKVGNRKTQSRQSGDLFYLYDDGNRLLEIHQGSETGAVLYRYTYDDNGSRIEKRDGENNLIQGYAWDQKRRIESVQQGSGAVDMVYDTSDYRVGKQSGTAPEDASVFYREAEHLEAVYDGNDTLKEKYLRGTVVDELINGYSYDENGQGTSATYHDHLRSVVAETGHDGAVLSTIQYDPFGNVLNDTGIPQSDLRYTGRMVDPETGLYYYRARYYDAEVGRFISEDPLGFEAGVNFYAYVLNNPINNADPSGLCPECPPNPREYLDREIRGYINSANNLWNNMVAPVNATTAAVNQFHQDTSAIGVSFGGSGSIWVSGGLQTAFVLDTQGNLVGGTSSSSGLGVQGASGDASLYFSLIRGTNGASASDYFSDTATGSVNYGPVLVTQSVLAGEYGEGSAPSFTEAGFAVGMPSPSATVTTANSSVFLDFNAFDWISGNSTQTTSSASGGFVIYPSRINVNTSGAYGK